ncbi:MAG: hypothetical protein ACTSRP_11515 [Candidatus Helarchaeota archaeon]
MPGSNICRKDSNTVRDSWRFEIFEIFRNYEIENITLLDILWSLYGYSPKSDPQRGIILEKCPATQRCTKNIAVPKNGMYCPNCNKKLYPTDALRIYEEVQEAQSNITPLKRLMICLEHINMIGYLCYLIERRPDVLKDTAFIIDGPLALFGPQAWFHRAILNFINKRIYETLLDKKFRWPVIVGVEKTGYFAEHSKLIGKYLSPQSLMIIDDDYIYKYILASEKTHSNYYGSETYYGQKMFYKTKNNQILTITIPMLKKEPFSMNILKHPVLYKTLNFLDNIGTIIYEDSLIPIALAHSFASIPLKTGSKVLKILSEEKLKRIR